MGTVAYTNTAANALILTGGGNFYGAHLAAGADAATAVFYDNTAGSGTVICKLSAAATAHDDFSPGHRLPVSTGIYVVVTGTLPSVTVLFTP